MKLLEVKNLQVLFPQGEREYPAVRGISFELATGEILGIVGESGSGKSVTSLAILNLVDPPGRIGAGEVLFQGENLLALPQEALQKIRGNKISFIFQDPAMALNPVLTVGEQLMEGILAHQKEEPMTAKTKAMEMLKRVQILEPERRFHEYPHQLSGGQKQRVMIGMALINRPALIIADEPTTALDVTVQAEILQLLGDLVLESESSVILITHDLRVASEFCQRLAVMYAGWIVEEGTAAQVLDMPRHPYTQGLLDALPTIEGSASLKAIPGHPPTLSAVPSGCPFHPRCSRQISVCAVEEPPFVIEGERRFRCFNPVVYS